jgi:thymidine kinase
MDAYAVHIKPGFLEVFTGPMKSGKTRELLHRIDKLSHIQGCDFLLFKPAVDTRDQDIKSRFGTLSHQCLFVAEDDPKQLLEHVREKHRLVAIDEAHFFVDELIDVVRELLLRRVNVVVAGLDLDFRAEPFGPMPLLLSMADEVHKLHAICDVPACTNLGTRTQRVVNGKPARYDDPVVLVGDVEEGYEVRCIEHHRVAGKVEKRYRVLDGSLNE